MSKHNIEEARGDQRAGEARAQRKRSPKSLPKISRTASTPSLRNYHTALACSLSLSHQHDHLFALLISQQSSTEQRFDQLSEPARSVGQRIHCPGVLLVFHWLGNISTLSLNKLHEKLELCDCREGIKKMGLDYIYITMISC